MNHSELRKLWELLGQTWGARFSEQYGRSPNDAWSTALAGIGVQAAQHAYRTLVRDTPEHPPTLPSFVAAAQSWRPPSATVPLLGKDRPVSTEELRAAASREVASFETYRDYTRWRATNTRKQTLPPHPTAGSADWLYLQRLAWIEAAIENASAARG